MARTAVSWLMLMSLVVLTIGAGSEEARAAAVDGDWPNYGRDGSEQHYSPLSQITTGNIGELSLAWHYESC